MKYIRFAVTTFLILPLIAFAGEVKVSWGEFDDFLDVRPANETKSGFHERIKTSFEKSFSKLGQVLPEGRVLEVYVTDLDLAGDVRHRAGNEYRQVERVDFPRMNFDFKLINAEGVILKEGSESLKDMNFLDSIRASSQHRDDNFYYEKRMFEEWFEENIEAQFK